MANRRAARSVVRTVKRPTFWEGAQGSAVLLTATVATAPLVSEATLENVPSPTLIRIHGEVFMHVTARTAAGDAAVIGLGIMGQSSRSIGVGVTAMPTPNTDIGSPWIMNRRVVVDSNVAPPNGTDIGGNVRVLIDNKSMRKFDLNQGLQLMLENTALAGTITISIAWAFRFLFKR